MNLLPHYLKKKSLGTERIQTGIIKNQIFANIISQLCEHIHLDNTLQDMY
jgi:hypothetical protein